MIVGIGYVGAGLGLSLLVRLVLSVARALESRALGAERESRIELGFETNGGKTRVQIEMIMEDFHVRGGLNGSEPEPDGACGNEVSRPVLKRATLSCRLHRRHYREFLNEIAKLPEVKTIKELTTRDLE